MRTFSYRARNSAGRIVESTILAEDKVAAQHLMERDGLIPIRIDLTAERNTGGFSGKIFGRVKDDELISFTRQLATLLKAGLPILQTIHVLKMQSDNPKLQAIAEDVAVRISGGARLSEAFAEFPRVFSSQYVSIVSSGESGADLVHALTNLAEWMEHELEIKTEIKSALRYPAMVVTALFGVAILLVVFVIPRFASLFTGSGVPLPLPTRMLVRGSHLLQHYWPILLVAVVLAVVGAVAALRTPVFRRKFDEWKFHLPVWGPIYSKIAISRFSRILAMLVRNGVPVIKSLTIAPGVVGNSYLTALVQDARKSIESGSSIADAFRQMPILPPMVTSLIAIGEKTGAVDEMLDHLVSQYDRDVRYVLKNLPTTIEPIITVIMGLGVLFLALALFLPIWNMSQAIIRP